MYMTITYKMYISNKEDHIIIYYTLKNRPQHTSRLLEQICRSISVCLACQTASYLLLSQANFKWYPSLCFLHFHCPFSLSCNHVCNCIFNPHALPRTLVHNTPQALPSWITNAIGIDTNIEVIVVSGCGDLPRSLMRQQWPKLRYQFLFYHDKTKSIMNKQIRRI